MNKAVLDSSALLAFINQENGSEIVEKYLPNYYTNYTMKKIVILLLLGVLSA
jgi:PIN domain nuclease of toxin-antitoxin system